MFRFWSRLLLRAFVTVGGFLLLLLLCLRSRFIGLRFPFLGFVLSYSSFPSLFWRQVFQVVIVNYAAISSIHLLGTKNTWISLPYCYFRTCDLRKKTCSFSCDIVRISVRDNYHIIYAHSHDHVSSAPSSPVLAVMAGGFEDWWVELDPWAPAIFVNGPSAESKVR